MTLASSHRGVWPLAVLLILGQCAPPAGPVDPVDLRSPGDDLVVRAPRRDWLSLIETQAFSYEEIRGGVSIENREHRFFEDGWRIARKREVCGLLEQLLEVDEDPCTGAGSGSMAVETALDFKRWFGQMGVVRIASGGPGNNQWDLSSVGVFRTMGARWRSGGWGYLRIWVRWHLDHAEDEAAFPVAGWEIFDDLLTGDTAEDNFSLTAHYGTFLVRRPLGVGPGWPESWPRVTQPTRHLADPPDGAFPPGYPQRALGSLPYRDTAGRVAGVAFRVWAPHSERVAVVDLSHVPEDFDIQRELLHERLPEDNWSTYLACEGRSDPGAPCESGIWSGDVPQAAVGDEYRYLTALLDRDNVPWTRRDPRGQEVTVSHSIDGNTLVYDPAAFDWEEEGGDEAGFERPWIEDTVIYNFSFPTAELETYGLIEVEDHFARLEELRAYGVTAIKTINPPVEHPDEFDPYVFTPFLRKRNPYGGARDLFAVERVGSGLGAVVGADGYKRLIRKAHGLGIAVYQNVAFAGVAHVNPNAQPIGHPLRRFDGWVSEEHREGIYFASPPLHFHGTSGHRFDFAEPRVRDFVIDNLRMWVQEYHVDGFRFDSVAYIHCMKGHPDYEGWATLQEANEVLDDLADGSEDGEVDADSPPILSVAEDWFTPWWPTADCDTSAGMVGEVPNPPPPYVCSEEGSELCDPARSEELTGLGFDAQTVQAIAIKHAICPRDDRMRRIAHDSSAYHIDPGVADCVGSRENHCGASLDPCPPTESAYEDAFSQMKRLKGPSRVTFNDDVENSFPGESWRMRKLASMAYVVHLTSLGIPFLSRDFDRLDIDGDGEDEDVELVGYRELLRDLIHLRRNLGSEGQEGVTQGLLGRNVEVRLAVDNCPRARFDPASCPPTARKLIAYHRWDDDFDYPGRPGNDVMVIANFTSLRFLPGPGETVPFPQAGRWYVHVNTDAREYGVVEGIEGCDPEMGDDLGCAFAGEGPAYVDVPWHPSGDYRAAVPVPPYTALILSRAAE